MSENRSCPACGAPIGTGEKCDYCGAENPYFVKPKVQAPRQPQPVYVPAPAPQATAAKAAPSSPAATTKYTSDSFYNYTDRMGKTVVILMCIIATSFLLIAANEKWYKGCYYAAGGTGGGSGFALLICFLGPFSVVWAVRSFIPPRRWRPVLSFFIWFAMMIVHAHFFTAYVPKQ